MNRRSFIRGALALPFASIGATERFLVGRYGAPAVMAGAEINMFAMIVAMPWILKLMDREMQKKEKEPLMKAAIQALEEAVPCGEPS